MTNNNEKFDFEPWDTNVYTGLEKSIGPDGMIHFCVYNEEKYKYVQIYTVISNR